MDCKLFHEQYVKTTLPKLDRIKVKQWIHWKNQKQFNGNTQNNQEYFMETKYCYKILLKKITMTLHWEPGNKLKPNRL